MTRNAALSPDQITADWIAVDWGATHICAWAMSDSGSQLAFCRAAHNPALPGADQFEPVLLSVIAPWLSERKTTVICCGNISAHNGWAGASCARAPCPPLTIPPIVAPTTHPQLDVRIIPGIIQPQPADLMHGEEARIAGFLALNPGWDGVICLPGHHSKWVHVSAGEVVSFQTLMTGEMFAALSGHTVLRDVVASTGWNEGAFDLALNDALSKPEMLGARLFSLHAETRAKSLTAEAARARLSGWLIGAELAAARPYWLGRQVAICGDSDLTNIYGAALTSLGCPAMIADGARMTLAGLAVAFSRLKESS